MQTSRGKQIKDIELKPDTDYPFIATDKNYGRAEFVVCPIYRYGKLREFHMFSKQQIDRRHYWVKFKDWSPMDWSISSWSHKGMENPEIWISFWCKEHKTIAQEFYVPPDSTKFTVNFGSNFSIDFDNAPPKQELNKEVI